MKKETFEELKERAKKFVEDKFNLYSDRSTLEDNWRKYNKLYNSLLQDKPKYDGIAKYVTPDTARAAKSAITFLDSVLFASKPFFKLQGVGGKNDNAKAEIITKILDLQQEKIKYRTQFKKFLRKLIIYGVAVAKVTYERKEKYVVKERFERKNFLNKLKSLFTGTINKALVPIYDNIKFEPLSIWNVYWDIYEKWENQTAIIERQPNISASSLRILANQANSPYFGIEKFLEENEDGYSNDSKTDQNPHLQDMTGVGDNLKDKKAMHEIMECWCNFDIDNDGIDEECIITLLDRKEVIRLELNPYDIQEKPYVFEVFDAIDEADSAGTGIPQLAEKCQEGLNDLYNQFFDNLNLILDCMMVVDNAAGIKNSTLKSRPRGIIHADGAPKEAIAFIRPPNITESAMRGIALLKDDIKQNTGSTATLQGLPARYDTSATEAAQMNSSSMKEIFSKMRSIEDNVVKVYLRKAYSYVLQFMSTNDIIKIVGSDAFGVFLDNAKVKVTDEDYNLEKVLLGDYDFIPLSVTEIENKVVKGQQLMNLFNIALKSPAGIFNVKNIAAKIIDVLANGDKSLLAIDFDKKLVSPENENILITQGESPRAKLQDPHEHHIEIHNAAEIPPEYEEIRKAHIEEHMKIMQLQAQMQANQAILNHFEQQAQMMNKMQPKQNGTPVQEMSPYGPGTITEGQAGQVQGYIEAPAGMGGQAGQIQE